jgi:hypothetical protein
MVDSAVEPFDDPADRWTRRGFHRCSIEPGSGAEGTRLRVECITVEVATPRVTEILMSQFGVHNLQLALSSRIGRRVVTQFGAFSLKFDRLEPGHLPMSGSRKPLDGAAEQVFDRRRR